MSLKVLLPVLLCLLLGAGCRDIKNVPAPAATDTITRLNEAGTIQAINSIAVNGPSWGGSQRISWLIAEGTQVAPGDTIIRFDDSEMVDYVQQTADDLEVRRLNVTSTRAQSAANQTRTNNAIAKARLAHEKAQLEVENQQYESQSMRMNAELEGRQAEISLRQAHRDSHAQATLDSLNIAQAALKEIKQDARVRRMQTYLNQLTALAPASGMVVYRRQYTEEGIKSYRAGDEVQQRATVLEITDTSAMKVVFTVHEKDRWRLKTGQKVAIILDAYTNTTFNGIVENVGRLPRAAVDGSVARRFEATAAIDNSDPRLKPGMSARVIIELGGSS